MNMREKRSKSFGLHASQMSGEATQYDSSHPRLSNFAYLRNYEYDNYDDEYEYYDKYGAKEKE